MSSSKSFSLWDSSVKIRGLGYKNCNVLRTPVLAFGKLIFIRKSLLLYAEKQ